MEVNELGPDELDGEDPDMDGWDDMYTEDNDNQDSEGEADNRDEVEFSNGDSDSADEEIQSDDDSVSISDGGEEDESSHKQPKNNSEADQDAFMDDSEDESDEEDPDENAINPLLDEESGMDWIDEDEDENSEEDEDTNEKGKKGVGNKLEELPTFASLEDYEEMINQSWNEMKRPAVDENIDDEMAERVPVKNKKKRRKR